MTKRSGVRLRYSLSFKQKVVREIEEEGLSLEAARRRYAIKGKVTVRRWVEQFGKSHLLNKVIRVEMKEERDRLQELEAEVKRLKIALADSVLAHDLLQTLIQVANEHYQTDLKKNFGLSASADSPNRKKSTR